MNQTEDFKAGFFKCKHMVLEMAQGWDIEFKAEVMRRLNALNYSDEFPIVIADTSLIDNIVFEDIDPSDAPDYSDAYIVSADYNGVPMNDRQIDALNENSQFVYERLIDYLN
jgi:hypothetical protein